MNMHNDKEIKLDELLSPSAASRLLPETSASTLQRWARQGKLPVVQMPSGRLYFSRSDILALLDPVRLSEEPDLTCTGKSEESKDLPLPGFEV